MVHCRPAEAVIGRQLLPTIPPIAVQALRFVPLPLESVAVLAAAARKLHVTVETGAFLRAACGAEFQRTH